MTERNVGKRIELKELVNDAWTKGPIYSEQELHECMRERLEEYHKIRQAMILKKEEKRISSVKASLIEKAISMDSLFSIYNSECKEINAKLDKINHNDMRTVQDDLNLSRHVIERKTDD